MKVSAFVESCIASHSYNCRLGVGVGQMWVWMGGCGVEWVGGCGWPFGFEMSTLPRPVFINSPSSIHTHTLTLTPAIWGIKSFSNLTEASNLQDVWQRFNGSTRRREHSRKCWKRQFRIKCCYCKHYCTTNLILQ